MKEYRIQEWHEPYERWGVPVYNNAKIYHVYSSYEEAVKDMETIKRNQEKLDREFWITGNNRKYRIVEREVGEWSVCE